MTQATREIDWTSARRWYDENAGSYEKATQQMPISRELEEFAAGLEPGARILDAGCGAGRDTLWLCDKGFDVSGFDLSLPMLEITHARTSGRAKLRHLDLCDFRDPPGSWDAIWAMASLLHLPKSDLGACISRLLMSLSPNGRMFAALKAGHGEQVDASGRPFAFYQVEELLQIVSSCSEHPLRIFTSVTSAPAFDAAQQRWINLEIRRRATS